MADTTLRLRYPTGATLYTQIESGAGVWNGTDFVAFAVADWPSYATLTTETPAASGRYVCQFPTTAAAGNSSWSVYLQAAGSPASTDVCVGGGDGYWDGTTFGGSASVTDAVTLPTTPPSGYSGGTILHAGTAQAGTATTITLDAGASSVNDQYIYCTVALVDGAGAGQAAVISAYDGTTKIATFTNEWATIPDETTGFRILPQGAVVVGQIAGGPRTVTQDWQGTGSLTVISSINGQPILGATVKAYLATAFATSGPAAPIIAQTTTDANGHWSLALNPANYSLVFGYGTESATAVITVN